MSKATQWKKQVYADVMFPSGKTADLRRPSIMSLVSKGGDIPNVIMNQLFGGGKKPNGETMSETEQLENMKGLMYLAEKIAISAFVCPVIIENPDYDLDQISMDDLDDDDKMFLVDWVMTGGEPLEALSRFHQSKSGASVASA